MMKIDKNVMAKGYQEMAEINLRVINEFFQAECKGESLGYGKMGTEETKKEA